MTTAKASILDNLVRNQVEMRPEKTTILFQKRSINDEAPGNDFSPHISQVDAAADVRSA